MRAEKRETVDEMMRALDRARRRGERAESARLAEALGDAFLASRDFASAASHFGTIRREGLLRPAGDRVRLLIKEAKCLHELDRCRQALRRLGEAIHLLRGSGEERLSAHALGLAADVCLQSGRVRLAYRYAEEASQVAARRGVGSDALRIRLSLGAVFSRLGRWEEAGALFEDVLSAARRSGDMESVGRAYNNLGLVHKNRCEWGRAIDCLEQAIRLAQREQPARALAERLNNLGIVHYKTGDWKRAEGAWREALRIARRVRDRRTEASVLLGMGRLRAARGHLERAEAGYAKAIALARETDDLRTEALGHEFLADLRLDAEDTEGAAQELERAKALVERAGPSSDVLLEIQRVQARLASLTDSPPKALRLIAQGLEGARRMGDRYEEANLLALRAEVRAREGNPRAGSRFQEAIEYLSDLGIRHPLARTLVRYAEWMAAAGGGTPARDRVQECLIVASEVLERLGDVRGLTEARVALARWKLKNGGTDGALSILRGLEEMKPGSEGLCLRLAELREELERRLVEGMSTGARTRELPGALSADSPCPADLLEGVAASVGADRALWAASPRTGSQAAFVATVGLEDEEAGMLAGWILKRKRSLLPEGSPVLSVSPASDPRFARSEWFRTLRSVIVLPLFSSDGLRGVVYLDRGQARGFPFGAREIRKLAAARPALEMAFPTEGHGGAEGVRVVTPAGVKIIPFILGGPKIANVLSVVGRVCDSNVPVLICGETGTGKELVAKALHELSARRSKPFVVQNCAAIPRELVESELFGYVSGAFTGAVATKAGLFEAAEGGTFFLDEVAETDAATQVKLLRLLEMGEIRPLGSLDARRVNVRLVSATNRSLEREVERGSFREDLFYRLNVVSVELPPLRERPGDIPILANEFLRRSFSAEGKVEGRLSDETLGVLAGYAWPGNVRELENEMKRLAALSPGGNELAPNLLSPRIQRGEGGGPVCLAEDLQSIERRKILETLEAEGWNLSRAARVLGRMPRSTLASKMKRLGIQRG